MKLTRRSFLKIASSALLGVLTSRYTGRAKPEGILKISTPFSLDAFPVRFADREGIFQANGLDVELVTMKDVERRKALSTGNLDCIVGDVSGTIFEIANAQADIAVTSTAFERIDDGRTLALLGSGRNYMNVTAMEDLFKRINSKTANSIALPRRTDIEFATDQLLSKLGYEVDEKTTYWDTDLTEAFGFLIFGSVLSSALSEPLATLAGEENSIPNSGSIKDGEWGFELHNYEGVAVMPSVIVFRKELIQENPGQIERFYKAYTEAVKLANTSPPESLIQIAIDMGLEVFREIYNEAEEWEPPENFEEVFEIPEFPLPQVLEGDEFEAVANWALQKRYIRTGIIPTYDEVVDNRFLA